MTGMRVHELAKEMDITSKELMERMTGLGINVKSNFNVVSAGDLAKIKSQNAQAPSNPPNKGGEAARPSSRGTDAANKPPSAQPPAAPRQPQSESERGGRPSGERPAARPQGGYAAEQGRPRQGQGQPSRPGQPGQGQMGQGQPGQGQRRPGDSRPPGEWPRPQRPPGSRPPGERPAGERRPPGEWRSDRPRPQGGYSSEQGQRPRPAGQSGPGQGQMGQGQPGQGQRRPGDSRPPGEWQRPQRPPGSRPPGERPAGGRPAGEWRSDRPRPQGGYSPEQGQRPRPAGQGQGQSGAPGQGQTGYRRPGDSRPQGDRRPGGPGGYPPRRPNDGRPAQGGFRDNRQPGRPGDKKPVQTSRVKIEGKTVELTVAEHPLKRQAPAQKKAHEKDRSYDKRRASEKDFPLAGRRGEKTAAKEPLPPKHIIIPESLTVQELASIMSKKAGEVIKQLLAYNIMATINQQIDSDTAGIVAADMGMTVEVRVEKSLAVVEEIEDDPDNMRSRPPVVTVMGHVDHGKTSLLDAIRSTNVTASEAGGITQHIGAYQVEYNGQKITFLDTPGHEAFTAMRARGAQVTDIAVLVVAADDGVMPQTVEAINHAKAAGVPIIIAINKIDKPGSNPERVKQELTEYGLLVEDWGGDVVAVQVSAKARQNIENLLEMILLVAEMKDLKADPLRLATGSVIEAKLDKGKGPVATVLVAKGTLNVGDIFVAGRSFGRIRAMVDDKGRRVKKAAPAMPVEVHGLSETPAAGDVFHVVTDEKLARGIVGARIDEHKAEEVKQRGKISLDDLFERIKEGEVKDLNIIIKGDVQGSVEALRQSLIKLSTAEARVNMIHGGVGSISESDVMLAAASNAIIIGFNVRHDANIKTAAELQGVDIRLYSVIYNAIDDVKAAMEGLLDPDFVEMVHGRAEVRQVIKVPKVGSIAGSYVLNGKILRASKARVIRDGVVIFTGELDSLRRFKDDVKEVVEGYECGIGLNNFNDVKEGDVLESYTMEEVKRNL